MTAIRIFSGVILVCMVIFFFTPASFWQGIHLDLPVFSAKEHVVRGLARLVDGRLDEAKADFDDAIKQEPNNATFYLARANYYLQRESYNDSISDVDQAIKLQPENSKAYSLRAEIRRHQHSYQSALKDANQAISMDRTDTTAYLVRSNIYSDLKQPDNAIQDMNQVLAYDPKQLQVCLILADLYREQANYNRALAMLDKAYVLCKETGGDSRTLAKIDVMKNEMGRLAEYKNAQNQQREVLEQERLREQMQYEQQRQAQEESRKDATEQSNIMQERQNRREMMREYSH